MNEFINELNDVVLVWYSFTKMVEPKFVSVPHHGRVKPSMRK